MAEVNSRWDCVPWPEISPDRTPGAFVGEMPVRNLFTRENRPLARRQNLLQCGYFYSRMLGACAVKHQAVYEFLLYSAPLYKR